MDVNPLNDIYNNSCYKIRCLQSLAEQVKNDFADVTVLLERFESGTLDISEIEQILQKISWIKESLSMLNKLNMTNIEGVVWGEMGQIQMMWDADRNTI
jgi:hypothetical protein